MATKTICDICETDIKPYQHYYLDESYSEVCEGCYNDIANVIAGRAAELKEQKH